MNKKIKMIAIISTTLIAVIFSGCSTFNGWSTIKKNNPYIISSGNVYRLNQDKWVQIGPTGINAEHVASTSTGTVYILSMGRIYKLQKNKWELTAPENPGAEAVTCSPTGTLWIISLGKIYKLIDNKWIKAAPEEIDAQTITF